MATKHETPSDRPLVDTTLKKSTEGALLDAATRLMELAKNPWKGDGFAHQVHLVAIDLDFLEDDISLQASRARISLQTPETVGDAIRQNIRGLREWSGWTQTEIAEGMNRLGFVTWKRITVAEAESGKRRLSIEELIGYGILFGTTASLLALPRGIEASLVVNERLSISYEEASKILAGWVGEPGGVDEDDHVGAQIIGVSDEDVGLLRDWRPVVNQRKARRSTSE